MRSYGQSGPAVAARRGIDLPVGPVVHRDTTFEPGQKWKFTSPIPPGPATPEPTDRRHRTPQSMGRAAWERILTEAWERGDTATQISEQWGIPAGTVGKQAARLGLTRRQRGKAKLDQAAVIEAYRQAGSLAGAARLLGCSDSGVRGVLQACGHYVPKARQRPVEK